MAAQAQGRPGSGTRLEVTRRTCDRSETSVAALLLIVGGAPGTRRILRALGRHREAHRRHTGLARWNAPTDRLCLADLLEQRRLRAIGCALHQRQRRHRQSAGARLEDQTGQSTRADCWCSPEARPPAMPVRRTHSCLQTLFRASRRHTGAMPHRPREPVSPEQHPQGLTHTVLPCYSAHRTRRPRPSSRVAQLQQHGHTRHRVQTPSRLRAQGR